MENSIESHLICIETTHFTVFYSKEDCGIVNQVVAAAEDMYEHTTKQFDLTCSKTPYRLYLCKDVESFRYHAHKNEDEYQEWMVGNVDPYRNEICILSPRVIPNRDMDNMLCVVRHEVVHSIFNELIPPEEMNIVLAEGIAVALAQQINLCSLHRDTIPLMSDLLNEAYFYSNPEYDFAGAYVEYFLRKYGNKAFLLIYQGKEDVRKYFYEGFERDAIKNLLQA